MGLAAWTIAVTACSNPQRTNDGANAGIVDSAFVDSALVDSAANPESGVHDDATGDVDSSRVDSGEGGVHDAEVVDAGAPDGTIADATPSDTEVDIFDASMDEDVTDDAASADGRNVDVGPTGPLFANCVDSWLGGGGQGAPLVIAEVIDKHVNGNGLNCHCGFDSVYVPNRFICGSFDWDAAVSISACGAGLPTPELPALMVVRPLPCKPGSDVEKAIYGGLLRPMSDWDAMVSEQIDGRGDADRADVVDASTD